MKKKTLKLVAYLAAACSFCALGGAVATYQAPQGYVANAAAGESTKEKVVIDEVKVHASAADAAKILYLEFYSQSVLQSPVLESNGTWLAWNQGGTYGAFAQQCPYERPGGGGGSLNAQICGQAWLCFNWNDGSAFADGDTFTLPEGLSYNYLGTGADANVDVNWEMGDTFKLVYSATDGWSVLTGDEATGGGADNSDPSTDESARLLSDFTESSVTRLVGDDFMNACVNIIKDYNGTGDESVTSWGTDQASSAIKGEYVTAANAPEGSTNGAYKISWAETAALCYPAVMFDFTNTDVVFTAEDELVIRIYCSEGMSTSYTLWATSSLEPKVWDAQKTVAGVTLTRGEWVNVRLNAADFTDPETGKIAPIAFIWNYAGLSTTPATEIYFDTATFVEVPKVLAEEYTTKDISEVVPVGEGIDFVGAGDGGETFDFTVEKNVKFARKDAKNLEAVKMMITVNDLTDFDAYFVMNGTGLYYENGGIYYWLSEGGLRIGYFGKAFELAALPEGIAAGTAFELELRAIPYYVNGTKSGYFAQALINGTEMGEGGYISSADCMFGNWFGLYMHNTTDAVTVNLKPVAKSETAALELTLKTQMNVTQIASDDFVKLETTLVGEYLNQSDITLEIVSGSDYGYIDEEGYLNGVGANGEVTMVAKITNAFGTFTSNEITVMVGEADAGNNGGDSGNGGSDDTSSGGCGGSISACVAVAGLALAGVVLCKKRKTE